MLNVVNITYININFKKNNIINTMNGNGLSLKKEWGAATCVSLWSKEPSV